MNNEETLTHFPIPPISSQQEIELQKKKTVFLKQENQCYICGNTLSTDIEYIPFTRFMVEKAKCTGCNTLNRVKNHSLQ